jgi:hypothetical protein
MKSTLGAFIIAVALVAGAGAASAMPSDDGSFTWEAVFEPGN